MMIRSTSTTHRRTRLHVRAACCALVAASLAAVAFLIDLGSSEAPSVARIESADAHAASAALESVNAPAGRPRYRYSVIPGGVYSREELAEAMRQDVTVAAHYGTVDSSRVRVIATPAPRLAHVSYRIGDRVFWTRRPVRLPAGETLLTDGDTEIRARCGNAVSDIAREPVSDVEPLAAALDEPLSDSSVAGARDLIGSRPQQMAHVPFLLAAQGASGGQDVGVPNELRPLTSWAPMFALPSIRGQQFDDRGIGGSVFLTGIAGSEETDKDKPHPNAGPNSNSGSGPGDGSTPGGGSGPESLGPESAGPENGPWGPGDGTIAKEYPAAEDVIDDEDAPAVPEPGTLSLVALGLATVTAVRHRRR